LENSAVHLAGIELIGNSFFDLKWNRRFDFTFRWSNRPARMAAEGRGPLMHARIGMLQALHRHKPKAAAAPRRKRAKVYKVIR